MSRAGFMSGWVEAGEGLGIFRLGSGEGEMENENA